MGGLENMDHVVSTNLKNNQVNYAVYKTLKYDSNCSLDNLIKNPQAVVAFDLITGIFK